MERRKIKQFNRVWNEIIAALQRKYYYIISFGNRMDPSAPTLLEKEKHQGQRRREVEAH